MSVAERISAERGETLLVIQLVSRLKKGSPVHVAPACAGSGEGSDHFGSIVRSLSLRFCKRLFPGLEPVTSWSQGSSFTTAPRLLAIGKTSAVTFGAESSSAMKTSMATKTSATLRWATAAMGGGIGWPAQVLFLIVSVAGAGARLGRIHGRGMSCSRLSPWPAQVLVMVASVAGAGPGCAGGRLCGAAQVVAFVEHCITVV